MKVCICSRSSEASQLVWRFLISYSYVPRLDFESKRLNSPDDIDYGAYPFDILFIDAAFRSETDGIEKAMELRRAEVDAFIVVMAPDDFELGQKAYSAEISSYLITPFGESDIEHVMDSILKRMSWPDDRHNRMLVMSLAGPQVIHNTELISIVADTENRHRKLMMPYAEVETTESLADIYARLPQKRFTYTHRSYIVNLNNVVGYDYDTITMSNGTKVPLSRVCRNDFIEAINSLFG